MLYTDGCLDITLLHRAWFSFQISQHCKFALHPLQNNKSGNPARLIHWTSLPCWTTDTLTKIIQIHSSLICVKQCFCLKVEFWWNVLLHYTGSSFPPMIILLIMCYYSIRPIYMPGPAFAMTTLWAISNIDRRRPSEDKTSKGSKDKDKDIWWSCMRERPFWFIYQLWKWLRILLDKIKEKTSFYWKCDFIRFFYWSSMWGFLTNQTTLWGFSEQSVTNIKGCRWLIWRCGYIWTKFHLTHLMKAHFLKVYESSLDQPKWLRFLDPTDATWEIPERRTNFKRWSIWSSCAWLWLW